MPSAGPRYSLGTMSRYTAGEAIERGQWLYLHASGSVRVAKSNDVKTAKVIGAAFIPAPPGGKILVIHHGEFPGFEGLDPTSPYFLQEDGYFGTLPPSPKPGHFLIKLGFAKDSRTFHIQIGEPKIRK